MIVTAHIRLYLPVGNYGAIRYAWLNIENWRLKIEDCRHRKKHDADRCFAYNLLILLGPVAGRETFYEYIKIEDYLYIALLISDKRFFAL